MCRPDVGFRHADAENCLTADGPIAVFGDRYLGATQTGGSFSVHFQAVNPGKAGTHAKP